LDYPDHPDISLLEIKPRTNFGRPFFQIDLPNGRWPNSAIKKNIRSEGPEHLRTAILDSMYSLEGVFPDIHDGNWLIPVLKLGCIIAQNAGLENDS
jgi:hypothetical protein